MITHRTAKGNARQAKMAVSLLRLFSIDTGPAGRYNENGMKKLESPQEFRYFFALERKDHNAPPWEMGGIYFVKTSV